MTRAQHSAQVETAPSSDKVRISCLCGHQTDWFASLSAAINSHDDHIWQAATEVPS